MSYFSFHEWFGCAGVFLSASNHSVRPFVINMLLLVSEWIVRFVSNGICGQTLARELCRWKMGKGRGIG